MIPMKLVNENYKKYFYECNIIYDEINDLLNNPNIKFYLATEAIVFAV